MTVDAHRRSGARACFIAVAAVLAGAPFHASASNLIADGSFEDAADFVASSDGAMYLAPGSTAMPGWTVGAGAGLAWLDPDNHIVVTAADGTYFVDMNPTGVGSPLSSLSQSISTVAGASYLLTYELGSADGPSGILASAAAASAESVSTLPGINNWEVESLAFTAIGSTTEISFVGDQGRYIGLDNVSVTQVGGGVPEPATWALMISGFGLAGAVLRRRRAGIAA